MKTNLLLLSILMLTVTAYAQVGIGTTNPDPSSAMEISSTEAGMLTPRMTTAQRNAIASPATGLLVYDTDLDLFHFYDGTVWEPLGTAEIRDNYKLVKSVADLTDELVAGGGAMYQLNTNFLYEINGTVVLDYPVDLNGAYVEGVDSGEDILLNASGSTMFTGATGGSLRNLTISGGGQQIFSLTGGTLVINNSIISGGSSVGSLTNLSLAFLSIVQFVGNSNGFTVNGSTGTSHFMNNTFWTDTNTGTFLNFSGTFDNIQLANGRIVADAGETGINVSTNPVINNSASLSGLNFVGVGTLVNPYTTGTYTGYNFSVDWDVNCEGIPLETDNTASANFYTTSGLTTGFNQSITNGTAVEIQGNGTFATNNLFRFGGSGGNNRVTYQGKKGRSFQATASLSVRVTNATGDFYAFVFAKNGSVVTESNSVVYIDSATQIQNVSLSSVIDLDMGDYIEVYVQRLTGSGNDSLIVFSENVSIK
ncbi:MAG: cell wall anchor protein [Flavobacteriaceae bacterium]|nr:cell wall anchor protein [Flavobacteriaceae bacterium]